MVVMIIVAGMVELKDLSMICRPRLIVGLGNDFRRLFRRRVWGC